MRLLLIYGYIWLYMAKKCLFGGGTHLFLPLNGKIIDEIFKIYSNLLDVTIVIIVVE